MDLFYLNLRLMIPPALLSRCGHVWKNLLGDGRSEPCTAIHTVLMFVCHVFVTEVTIRMECDRLYPHWLGSNHTNRQGL